MTPPFDVAWIALLLAEIAALATAQRRLFPWMARRVGVSVATAWAAPATVAHELSHATMALALGVPFGRRVGGRVELFRPRRQADGSLQLGVVHVARTDAIRSTLIAIAPAILVPAMLVAASWLLLGTAVVLDDPAALGTVPLWRVLLWALLILLVPTAAFPSIGDPVGWGGAILVGALALLLALGTVETLGTAALIGAGVIVAKCLLLPAAVCAGLMLLTYPRRR